MYIRFVFSSCQWLFLGRQWLNLGRWWVGWLNSGWYDIIYTGTNADDQKLINLGRWWLTGLVMVKQGSIFFTFRWKSSCQKTSLHQRFSKKVPLKFMTNPLGIPWTAKNGLKMIKVSNFLKICPWLLWYWKQFPPNFGKKVWIYNPVVK